MGYIEIHLVSFIDCEAFHSFVCCYQFNPLYIDGHLGCL